MRPRGMTLLPQMAVAFHLNPRPKFPRNTSINSNKQDSRWKQPPFDFSSKQGWEDFYKKGQPSHDGTADITSLEYEWHSHIPHSAVIKAISPAMEAAVKSTSQDDRLPSILIIGCGNSSLPRILHDAFDHPVRITCLDYSNVCIDMIREMYSDGCPNMDFVVGDAMQLREVINAHNNCNEDYKYDVVIDKGLMDALMCGEGFDCDTLQKGIDQVLISKDWGMHVLICFPLIKGIKENLTELGQQFDEQNLFWRFDLPVQGSENGRASFNVGKRSLWKLDPEVETSVTNWV